MRAQLLAGEDRVRRPGVVGVERHELDEADLEARSSGRTRQKRSDLVLGEAAHRHRVDLDRADLGKAAIASSPRSTWARESRRVIWKKRSRCERVDRDVDPVDAGLDQRGGVALEQVAVGGQGEVADALDPGQHRDQPGELAAHQRLAAGQAHVLDARAGRGAATRRSISSKLRISSRSSQGRPSAGMQYWQRKLQRSVTETRRSEIRRPWPSWSGSMPLIYPRLPQRALRLARWSRRRLTIAGWAASSTSAGRSFPSSTSRRVLDRLLRRARAS